MRRQRRIFNTVHDADSKLTATIAQELGCALAENAAGIAKVSDIIITMLPTSVIVADVLSGEGGILETIRTGTLIQEFRVKVMT